MFNMEDDYAGQLAEDVAMSVLDDSDRGAATLAELILPLMSDPIIEQQARAAAEAHIARRRANDRWTARMARREAERRISAMLDPDLFSGEPSSEWSKLYWADRENSEKRVKYKPPYMRDLLSSKRDAALLQLADTSPRVREPSSAPRVREPASARRVRSMKKKSSKEWHRQSHEDNPKYKSTLCSKWADGGCKFGDQCVFAHGEEELRDPKFGGKKRRTLRKYN